MTTTAREQAEALAEALIAIYGAVLYQSANPDEVRDGAHPGEECSRLFVEAIIAAVPDPSTPAEPPLEVCLCAAVLLHDGRIVRGHRHDDCIQTVIKWRDAGQETGRVEQVMQGFLTSRGRWVDRHEAAKLQQAAGIKSVNPRSRREFPTYLFSEDLY